MDVATPLRQSAPFDFGRTNLIEALRDMGLAMAGVRDLTHIPPPATLFLHRKIGGMYLLATKLKARAGLRPLGAIAMTLTLVAFRCLGSRRRTAISNTTWAARLTSSSAG